MYCPNCKKSMPDGMLFCGICGAPLVEKPKKSKKKKGFWSGLLCGLLIMALAGGIFYVVTLFTGRSRGCSTPEKAALAYFEAAKKGDSEEMLEAFALEEYVENFDLAAYCDYMITYSTGAPQYLPESNEYFRGINLQQRRGNIGRRLSMSYLSLALPDNNSQPIAVDREPYGSGEEFVKAIDCRKLMDLLSEIEVQKVIPAESFHLAGEDEKTEERLRRSLQEKKKYLGCEDLAEVVVKFTMDGEIWYQDLSMVKYDGKWFIEDLNGMVSIFAQIDFNRAGLATESEYREGLKR